MSSDTEPMNGNGAVVRMETALAENGQRPDGAAVPKAAAPNMLKMVHDALRGRYLAVVSAGLLAGALAAGLGWKLTRPKYTSEGLVRIAYSMPAVISQTDQNSPLPMFDQFMQSQKTLICSRRVIDLACMDQVWKGLNRQPPQNKDQYFAKHMSVEVKRLSELIRITVEDTDPTTAAAAVTAVVNSYQTLYTEQDERLNRNRLNKLEQDHKDLDEQIKKLTAQIEENAKDYGTTNLEVFFNSAFSRVATIEQALDKINIAIANAPAAQAATTGEAPQNAIPDAAPDPMVIAMTDATMRSYMDQQDQRLLELQRLKKSYPDTNDKVVVAMENLERAKLRVTNYAEMYRLFHKATAQNMGNPAVVGMTAGQSLEKLKENAGTLVKMLADTRGEMRAIGVKQLEFEKWGAQLAKLKEDYNDLGKRMDTLKTERSLGTRLSIISTGEVPLSPSTDKRLRMAQIAGAGGFLLPAAIVFGLSFVRRRYRYVDDTAKDSRLLNVPLLGMLPEVGRKFDAEVLHATAHGIHQMRVLLCAKSPRNSKRSYLITSATEGEGKTNLTVALGMSFAAARQRTLVIDCDFVGRRLTRGFKAEQSEGVFEAMRDGTLINRVRQESARLFVLPTGRVDSTDACGITTDNIRDLLEQTRGQFDTVIIDTGPILGSLEAAVVAQEVDGVILAISRGQHPTLVQHALERLESVNAVLAGAVFNRAKLQDFHSSAYTSSHTSAPYAESLSMERTGENTAFADFGPLVRAVSMGTPAAA